LEKVTFGRDDQIFHPLTCDAQDLVTFLDGAIDFGPKEKLREIKFAVVEVVGEELLYTKANEVSSY